MMQVGMNWKEAASGRATSGSVQARHLSADPSVSVSGFC